MGRAHGYYNCHCFLPLYVFCGDQLLVAYLRKSNIDAAKHAMILALLVKRLAGGVAEDEVKIVLRADSGFCRERMLTWCDPGHDAAGVVGMARSRLLEENAELMAGRKGIYPDGQEAARGWARHGLGRAG